MGTPIRQSKCTRTSQRYKRRYLREQLWKRRPTNRDWGPSACQLWLFFLVIKGPSLNDVVVSCDRVHLAHPG